MRSASVYGSLFHFQVKQESAQTSALTSVSTLSSTSHSTQSYNYKVFSPADSTSCVTKTSTNDSVSGSFYAILISDVGLTSQCVQVWVSLGVSTIKVEIVGGEWLTFYLGATATINSSTSWSVVQTSTAVVYGQPQGGTTVQKVVSGLKTTMHHTLIRCSPMFWTGSSLLSLETISADNIF